MLEIFGAFSIDACNKIILTKIVNEINAAECFAVSSDETTDVSTTEQLSVCSRFVKQNEEGIYYIEEHFLQFVPVVSTRGEDLASTIINFFKEVGVNIHFMRGQGYDNY